MTWTPPVRNGYFPYLTTATDLKVLIQCTKQDKPKARAGMLGIPCPFSYTCPRLRGTRQGEAPCGTLFPTSSDLLWDSYMRLIERHTTAGRHVRWLGIMHSITALHA